MATHNGGYVFLLVFLWLTFIATVTIHALAIFDEASFVGLFSVTSMSLEQQYRTELTRVSWNQYVWMAVYAFELLWLIYLTTTFARLDDEKDFIYIVGPVHQWGFYMMNILGLGQIIAWLFVFTEGLLLPASILSATGFVTTLIGFIIAIAGLAKHNIDLNKVGLPNEHTPTVLFIHNGLGAMVGWMAFSALDMMLICIQYYSGKFTQSTAETFVMITILTGMAMLIIYGILDMAFEKYTRFIYTPYIMAVLSIVGTFMNGPYVTGFPLATKNSLILVPALLALAGLLLVVKVLVSIIKEARSPAFAVEGLDAESDYE